MISSRTANAASKIVAYREAGYTVVINRPVRVDNYAIGYLLGADGIFVGVCPRHSIMRPWSTTPYRLWSAVYTPSSRLVMTAARGELYDEDAMDSYTFSQRMEMVNNLGGSTDLQLLQEEREGNAIVRLCRQAPGQAQAFFVGLTVDSLTLACDKDPITPGRVMEYFFDSDFRDTSFMCIAMANE